jgi:hypothetical protein
MTRKAQFMAVLSITGEVIFSSILSDERCPKHERINVSSTLNLNGLSNYYLYQLFSCNGLIISQ